MQKIKAVIFDLDDTLFDCTGQLVEEARKRAARVMAEIGLPLTEKQAYTLQLEIIRKFGQKTDVFDFILEKYNVPQKEEAKEKIMKAYNIEDVSGISLFPDAMPMMENLKEKGIKTAIVTSGLYSRQNKKIEILGLQKLVDVIVIHDIEKESSKENSFIQVMEKLASKPEETVSIGDRVHSEIKISNRLGMHTIQFLHGRFKDTKPKSDLEEPDFKIKKLSELEKVIAKIEKGKNSSQKIVIVGGGSGTSLLLEGLKKFTSNLTAIVTVTDTGRTTGKIRKELGVIGTGDVRNCLVALSMENGVLQKLFNYRFEEGSWKGYAFGSIFLAALAKTTGSYKKALKEASKILAIKGQVLPATLSDTHICVELENGETIEQEDSIVARNKDVFQRSPIKKAFLKPAGAKALPDAIQAIKDADAIVIGPGSLFTSIIPNLLIKGLAKAVRKSRAKKFFVCNIMTQQGQTDNCTASMHAKKIEEYLGKNTLDYVVVNTEVPEKKFLEAYEKEHSFMVKVDRRELEKFRAKKIFEKTMQKNPEKQLEANRKSYLRHDPKKISKTIMALLETRAW